MKGFRNEYWLHGSFFKLIFCFEIIPVVFTTDFEDFGNYVVV